AGADRPGAGRRRRTRRDHRARLEPARTDSSTPMSPVMEREAKGDNTTADRNVGATRWVATIAGLIGFLLSVATPLLPVVQTTATLNWPQNGQLNSVTAPLISLSPVDVTVTVPCTVVRDLPPEGGVVLSTAPKKGKDAALNALFVVVNAKRVDVTDR